MEDATPTRLNMFDFGFAVDKCLEEGEGFWFLFFADGAGGLWMSSDGIFRMGRRVNERGN